MERLRQRAARILAGWLDDDGSLPADYESARIEGDDDDAPSPPVRSLVLNDLMEVDREPALRYRNNLPSGILQAYALPVVGDDIQWQLANLLMQRELHLVKFALMLFADNDEDTAERMGKRAINLWHGLEEEAGLE